MSDNPLLEALPPATDYLTYLTILEYNLTPEQLPTLHEVLQDRELTSNIGWDLVHLLLPLLPASEQCLQDVARLGNPREVVLKVTEGLRDIKFDDSREGSDRSSVEAEHVKPSEESSSTTLGEHAMSTGNGNGSHEEAPQGDEVVSNPEHLSTRQFSVLLSMLSILHPRIKTKYPSRFLSTSLKAVLKAYARLAWSSEATAAIIQFVKTLSGQKRPNLPPRMSSREVCTISSQPSAPDPEAQSEVPSSEEIALQQRLLQSLVTHIIEDYISCMSSIDDVTGMAWTSRLQEKKHPEMTVPGRRTFIERFSDNEELHSRDAMVGQIAVGAPLFSRSTLVLTFKALARDLGINPRELLAIITQPDTDTEPSTDEDDLPSSASDIPLSRVGALYLLAAQNVSSQLFGSPNLGPETSIFPSHAHIVQHCLASDNMASIGTEAETVIDSVLCLGVCALNTGRIGLTKNDEQFNEYLQRLSLLSANTPSPTLRYHAHTLTSSILHSHPSDLVRLAFIRDTLEHCPYENLKASAVGWLKDEILAAEKTPDPSTIKEPSVFATPVAIDTLAPYIFPDLTSLLLKRPSNSDPWPAFAVNFSFYLASLNLYYLLLASQLIRRSSNIVDLHTKHKITERFLEPLRETSKRYRSDLEIDHGVEEEDQSGMHGGLSDLQILDNALERVSGALVAVGPS